MFDFLWMHFYTSPLIQYHIYTVYTVYLMTIKFGELQCMQIGGQLAWQKAHYWVQIAWLIILIIHMKKISVGSHDTVSIKMPSILCSVKQYSLRSHDPSVTSSLSKISYLSDIHTVLHNAVIYFPYLSLISFLITF